MTFRCRDHRVNDVSVGKPRTRGRSQRILGQRPPYDCPICCSVLTVTILRPRHRKKRGLASLSTAQCKYDQKQVHQYYQRYQICSETCPTHTLAPPGLSTTEPSGILETIEGQLRSPTRLLGHDERINCPGGTHFTENESTRQHSSVVRDIPANCSVVSSAQLS